MAGSDGVPRPPSYSGTIRFMAGMAFSQVSTN